MRRRNLLLLLGSLVGLAAIVTVVVAVTRGNGPGSVSPQGCVNPPPNMEAWWPLDETAGASTIDDIWIGNHDGAPQPGPVGSGLNPGSAPSINPPNVVVGSLKILTKNAYGNVPHDQVLNIGKGYFTIDAWVYDVGAGSPSKLFIAPIVDKFDANLNAGYALYLASDPSSAVPVLTFAYGDQNQFKTVTSAGASPPLLSYNTWHHVAVTVKSGGMDIRLYVDGTQQGVVSKPLSTNIASTQNLLIGGTTLQSSLSAGFREIAIDELEIFKSALSQSEIQGIYNAHSSGKCRPEPGRSRLTPTPSAAPTSSPTVPPPTTPTPTRGGVVTPSPSPSPTASLSPTPTRTVGP